MKATSFYTLFLLSLLITSCSDKPQLSCDEGNFSKLEQVSRDFILSNTSADSKASAISFDAFEVNKSSCRLLKRQKRVEFSLNAKGTQASKTKKLRFDCSFGKPKGRNQEEVMDAKCRLVSIK